MELQQKLSSLPDVAVINPEDFKKLLVKYDDAYYKELNKKFFYEVPYDFWKELFQKFSDKYIELCYLFANPFVQCLFPVYTINALRQMRRGFENFCNDYLEMMKLKEPDGYKVGVNIAVSPKETVYSSKLLNLYRYKGERSIRPILFAYSYINGYYILDLMPGKSVVEHFVKKGFDVFITDWQPPKGNMRTSTLEDYISELQHSVRTIQDITGKEQIGGLGYCIGGTLLDIVAALQPDDFKYIINLTTGLDTKVGKEGAGPFGAYTDTSLVDLEQFLKVNNGVFPSFMMNFFFDSVKPKNKAEQVFESYIEGKKHKPDPVLFWNIESSRDVPGPAHYKFLVEIYNKNSLAKAEMSLFGKKVCLKAIQQPYCNVIARYDHIIPLHIGLQNSFVVGTPLDKQKVVLVQGGHVRGVANPKMFPFISSFAEENS